MSTNMNIAEILEKLDQKVAESDELIKVMTEVQKLSSAQLVGAGSPAVSGGILLPYVSAPSIHRSAWK